MSGPRLSPVEPATRRRVSVAPMSMARALLQGTKRFWYRLRNRWPQFRQLGDLVTSPRFKWHEMRAEPVQFYASAAHRRMRTAGLYAYALFGPAARSWRDGTWLCTRTRALIGGTRSFDLVPVTVAADGDPPADDPAVGDMFDCRPGGSGPLPCGWAMVSYEIKEERSQIEPVLFVDTGGGVPFEAALPLAAGGRGAPSRLLCLPRGRAWRLATMEPAGEVALGRLRVRPYWYIGALRALVRNAEEEIDREHAARMLNPHLEHARVEEEHARARRLVLRDVVSFMCGGSHGNESASYDHWVVLHDLLSDRDRATILRRIRKMNAPPHFDVVIIAGAASCTAVDAAVLSIAGQLYPHWALTIVTRAGTAAARLNLAGHAHTTVTEVIDAAGEAAAVDAALTGAAGSFVLVLHGGDRLAEHALYLMAAAVAAQPEAAVIYGDYDRLERGWVRRSPCFKPGWNYDLYLTQDLFRPAAAFRGDVVRDAGGFADGVDDCGAWDLGLRVVERVTPEAIVHLPYVLCDTYDAADASGAEPVDAARARARARETVNRHLLRTNAPAAVVENGVHGPGQRVRWNLPETLPLVSLVVPTRDHVELLSECLECVLERTTYPRFEVVVIDNGSTDPEAVRYLEKMSRDPRVTVLSVPGPFNFSRLCNRGVARARGDIYVLLNNDTQVRRGDWLDELVAHAVRPEVGAVGAKMLYPNGTIQHAGVILGVGGTAGHAYRGAPADAAGYCGRALVTQQLSAVTAACLAGRRTVFQEIGGFETENVGVTFNDVDFCLRLREAGYKVVWTPFAELRHDECGSRGTRSVRSVAERDLILSEAEYMERRWGASLLADPAYNPNLTLGSEDFARTGRPRVGKPWQRRSGARAGH